MDLQEMDGLQKRGNAFPPGLIGVAAGYIGRYNEFNVSLSQLICPKGSGKERFLGVDNTHPYNEMVRSMRNRNLEWLWILNDDHVFDPELLIKLLERDVDMVVPLCLQRSYPYGPVLRDGPPNYGWAPWDRLTNKKGLLDWTGNTCGHAGMLIKKNVFEAIPEIWFEAGKITPEFSASDIYFCVKVAKYGFKLFIDLDNPIGHCITGIVWPKIKENGEWNIDLKTP
jgi:hypothetical protein